MAEYYFIVRLYHTLSIQSPVDGHLFGLLYIWAIMNTHLYNIKMLYFLAAMNIHVQIFEWVYVTDNLILNIRI